MATLHMQLDFPALKGPLGTSSSTICSTKARKGPKNLPNSGTLAADSAKPKIHHILGYVAQNAILSAPNPLATTHFWWSLRFKIAPTDA